MKLDPSADVQVDAREKSLGRASNCFANRKQRNPRRPRLLLLIPNPGLTFHLRSPLSPSHRQPRCVSFLRLLTLKVPPVMNETGSGTRFHTFFVVFVNSRLIIIKDFGPVLPEDLENADLGSS